MPSSRWHNLWQEISDVRAFNQDVWASGVTAPHIHLGATWNWVSSCTCSSKWYIADWVDPTASVDACFRESQNSVFLGVQPWAHWLTELNKFNSLNADLNPICHLLELLGAHHILHVSRIRVVVGSISVFAKLFFFPDPFWLRKVTTDPHTLPHVNIACPVDGYPKVCFYISTDFR